jgi:hypothetical protein
MDFTPALITIRSGTDQWGPFAFEVGPALPNGDSLLSATVAASLNGADSTSDLIETGSVTVNQSVISLRFQYPGATWLGLHELRFALTLASGAKHTLVFRYVEVKA